VTHRKLLASHPPVLPLSIIGGWISIILLVDVITTVFFLLNVAGQGQDLSDFLLTSGRIAVYGLFVLSVVMSILYFRQFKKFWVAHSFFIVLLGALVLWDWSHTIIMHQFIPALLQLMHFSIPQAVAVV